MAEPELWTLLGPTTLGAHPGAAQPLPEEGIAALPEGFLPPKHYKCISPHQPFLRIPWQGCKRRFHPFPCGFAVIVWKELSPDSCRISSECLCPSDLAGMQVLLPGMVQWKSFHAPAVVCIKLCPEATNSLQTHLVAGTVPASGKLVGFFPRSDYNEEGTRQRRMCHFPIIDGKRRRMPLLLQMCSTVSVKVILILMVWVAPVFVPPQLGLLPEQERYSSSTGRGGCAQGGDPLLHKCTFFIWKEDTKCLSHPTQRGVLNPFFLSLLPGGFHWAQFLHQSKLKLKKTQQQGKVPSSPSTSSLQRDIFDNSVSFFPN